MTIWPYSYETLFAAVTGTRTPEGIPYVWFTRPFDLNLVGIRAIPGKADAFDDRLYVAWMDDFGPRLQVMPCTLDPGSAWQRDPLNANGSPIVGPGQHRGCYTPGLHKKDPNHRCLVQTKDVTGWRDRDLNGVPDRRGPQVKIPGGSGLQIHRCRSDNSLPRSVGLYSDGCCALVYAADLDYLMALVDTQAARGLGMAVTLTVLELPA